MREREREIENPNICFVRLLNYCKFRIFIKWNLLCVSQDSEIERTSTSPGPEATHRAHAIPPPAPADWVRKERLGKKGEFRYF